MTLCHMSQKFYTLDEVAELLRLSRRTVERAIARGDLHAVHIGRAVRIPQAELDRISRPAA